MAGISSRTLGKLENRYEYNGKENRRKSLVLDAYFKWRRTPEGEEWGK
jgi:hypothetical protein